MKTLEQIKNDYAVSKGFRYWSYLLSSTSMLDEHINEVMKIYAMECLKLASQNSKVLVEGMLTEERKTLFTLFDKGVKGVVKRKVSVCKESITNENNIIK